MYARIELQSPTEYVTFEDASGILFGWSGNWLTVENNDGRDYHYPSFRIIAITQDRVKKGEG